MHADPHTADANLDALTGCRESLKCTFVSFFWREDLPGYSPRVLVMAQDGRTALHLAAAGDHALALVLLEIAGSGPKEHNWVRGRVSTRITNTSASWVLLNTM